MLKNISSNEVTDNVAKSPNQLSDGGKDGNSPSSQNDSNINRGSREQQPQGRNDSVSVPPNAGHSASGTPKNTFSNYQGSLNALNNSKNDVNDNGNDKNSDNVNVNNEDSNIRGHVAMIQDRRGNNTSSDVNSSVLGLGDDYASMLNNLSYNKKAVINSSDDSVVSSNTNDMEKTRNENLESLIQHYEGLIKQHQLQQMKNNNGDHNSGNVDGSDVGASASNGSNSNDIKNPQNKVISTPRMVQTDGNVNKDVSHIGNKHDDGAEIDNNIDVALRNMQDDSNNQMSVEEQSKATSPLNMRSNMVNIEPLQSPNNVPNNTNNVNDQSSSSHEDGGINFGMNSSNGHTPNNVLVGGAGLDASFETPKHITSNKKNPNKTSKPTKVKPSPTKTPTSLATSTSSLSSLATTTTTTKTNNIAGTVQKKNKTKSTPTAASSTKNSNKKNNNNNSNSTVINEDKKICDHCRRRQTQCVRVPNLQNCIQCESKGIKCTYSELSSTKTSMELEQLKRARVDENVNVHDLLKRAKTVPATAPAINSTNSNSPLSTHTPAHNNHSSSNPNINTLQSYSDMLQNLAPQQFNYNNNIINNISGLNTGASKSIQDNNSPLTGDRAFSYMPKNSNTNSPSGVNFNDTSMYQQQLQYKLQQATQQQYARQALFNPSPTINNSPNPMSPLLVQQQLALQMMQEQSNPQISTPSINIHQSQFNGSNPSSTVAPSYPRSSFYVGPTSLFDYNLINHVKLDKIEQIQISPSLTLRKVAPNVQFVLRDDFNEKLYLKQEQEIDLVEKLVHPHGKVLVDIFFKVIHPYYPILHERVFMEKYSRSYRELTAPLLASIYSLALQWWDYHPQLVGFPKPNVTEQLNELALKTFFDVVQRPKLSIVQAGLLILMCRSESSNNWVIVSEVVALAEELGLGIDCQDWRLPRWERGLRRRLAWAVWSVDKWISASEGRYSHLILGRNWLVKMLSDDDFPDEAPSALSTPISRNNRNPKNPNGTVNTNSNNADTPFTENTFGENNSPDSLYTNLIDIQPTLNDIRNGKLLFQQFVSLSIILGEILDTFYTLGAMSITTKVDYVLKLAKPLQLKLREWYHSLPPQLSMNYIQSRKSNSNASLTLAYFAAEITLHRKIISTLDSTTPIELSHVCRQAAKTRLSAAIEFICELKVEHTSSFWYSCSSTNMSLIGSFAALLYCTSTSKEEKELYRNYLRKYIITLRISAKTFEKAKAALEFSQLLDEILV